jgi:carbonic anhydrase
LAGQEFKIPAFDVKYLLPKDTGKFYRYEGSLTTPPCFDNVTWTVLYAPVEISQQQVKFAAG